MATKPKVGPTDTEELGKIDITGEGKNQKPSKKVAQKKSAKKLAKKVASKKSSKTTAVSKNSQPKAPVRTTTRAFSITPADQKVLKGFQDKLEVNASLDSKPGSLTRRYGESFALRFAIRLAKDHPNFLTELERIRKELEAEDGRHSRHHLAS